MTHYCPYSIPLNMQGIELEHLISNSPPTIKCRTAIRRGQRIFSHCTYTPRGAVSLRRQYHSYQGEGHFCET
jgi:hypothetical protein